MKKILSVILFIMIIFTSVPIANAAGYYLIEVSAFSVNIRSGPGTENNILYRADRGTLLELLFTQNNAKGEKWYRVYDFNKNTAGYIAAWLTRNINITIQGEDADFDAKVIADVLNVRVGPGVGFSMVDVLNEGNMVSVQRIIRRSDGETWYRYQDKNGKYRYIAGWYTKKVETPPETPPETDDETSKATALYYINLREGPSLDYARIDLIDKGSELLIVGIARNVETEIWLEVQHKGKIGWAYGPLFDVVSSPPLDLSKIGSEGKIEDVVNVRGGPSTNYFVQTVLKSGTIVMIRGVGENEKKEVWYEITVNGETGWIRSDLVITSNKGRSELDKITWTIGPNGIDIVMNGKNLSIPSLSMLENPVRLTANFTGTIVESENAFLINLPPIIRVRWEQLGSSVSVTTDLNSRVPFKGEMKDSQTFILHLELPKVGEKKIDFSSTGIYASVENLNDKEYLSLNDFLNYFNTEPIVQDGSVSISLFGEKAVVDKSKLLEKDGEFFISLDLLSETLNVSVISTDKVIYIDPVLTEYKEENGKFLFTFSTPPKVKKEKSDSLYLIFYAECGTFDMIDSKERNGTAPPEIRIKVGKASETVNINTTGTKVTVSIAASKSGSLAGRIIVIDPGHGSYSGPYLDVGATGPTGIKEAIIVLDIAKRLRKLLEAEGATVILTHEVLDDRNNPTLAERCSMADNSGGDLFISIHLNASVNRAAHGTETYYWHSGSYNFAKAVQDSLLKNLNTSDRGVKKGYLYVCRNVTTMPSILTEILFVSNVYEESLCKNSSFLDKIAEALKEGIERYFSG